MPPALTRARHRAPQHLITSRKERFQCPSDPASRLVPEVTPRQKETPGRFDAFLRRTEYVPCNPSDPAPGDGVSCRATQGNDQPSFFWWVGRQIERQGTPRHPHARPADLRAQRVLAPSQVATQSHREAMATLSSTPLDHFLAVRRAHPLQETMARLSFASVWLVCSFHGCGSLWFGEAGILCPIRPIVKTLIVGCAFCLIGLSDRISARLCLCFLGYQPTAVFSRDPHPGEGRAPQVESLLVWVSEGLLGMEATRVVPWVGFSCS